MSFEEKIDALIAAVEANTAALNEVIGLTKEGGAAASKTTSSRSTKKADAKNETKSEDKAGNDETSGSDGDDAAVDKAKLTAFIKETLAPWLGEFGDAKSGHPETEARQEALKKALGQIGVEKASAITKAADLGRLETWFGKAKAVDKGFGAGRFAADPKKDDESSDGDLDL